MEFDPSNTNKNSGEHGAPSGESLFSPAETQGAVAASRFERLRSFFSERNPFSGDSREARSESRLRSFGELFGFAREEIADDSETISTDSETTESGLSKERSKRRKLSKLLGGLFLGSSVRREKVEDQGGAAPKEASEAAGVPTLESSVEQTSDAPVAEVSVESAIGAQSQPAVEATPPNEYFDAEPTNTEPSIEHTETALPENVAKAQPQPQSELEFGFESESNTGSESESEPELESGLAHEAESTPEQEAYADSPQEQSVAERSEHWREQAAILAYEAQKSQPEAEPEVYYVSNRGEFWKGVVVGGVATGLYQRRKRKKLERKLESQINEQQAQITDQQQQIEQQATVLQAAEKSQDSLRREVVSTKPEAAPTVIQSQPEKAKQKQEQPQRQQSQPTRQQQAPRPQPVATQEQLPNQERVVQQPRSAETQNKTTERAEPRPQVIEQNTVQAEKVEQSEPSKVEKQLVQAAELGVAAVIASREAFKAAPLEHEPQKPMPEQQSLQEQNPELSYIEQSKEIATEGPAHGTVAAGMSGYGGVSGSNGGQSVVQRSDGSATSAGMSAGISRPVEAKLTDQNQQNNQSSGWRHNKPMIGGLVFAAIIILAAILAST